MRFIVHGHPNTSSTHRTTIEFTRDAHLSERGDCVLGVSAGWKASDARRLAGYDRLKVTISVPGRRLADSFSCTANKDARVSDEIVFRKGGFVSERTLGTDAAKAACDIDRRIVRHLTDPKARAVVTIEPMRIRAVIFDFDNTLEEWTCTQQAAMDAIAPTFMERYGIGRKDFFDGIGRIIEERIGTDPDPAHYGRKHWFKVLLARHRPDLTLSDRELTGLEDAYWRRIDAAARLFPETKAVLRRLRPRYRLAVLSDSDGYFGIKRRRIRLLGVWDRFDVIMTGDKTGVNKPAEINFLETARRLRVRPEECMMVGDHPETDLIGAKAVGMVTVHAHKSRWGSCAHYPYVDYRISDLRELTALLARYGAP
ncbi:DUF371 domain-containing protein [Candidatus Woesearchaeota archaeon]|nr:DUF371 domain-containing protein [Candidatus Woesearchaeota archaeon]